MKTFLYPPQTSNVSVPPIQYELDGVATTVSKDTVTPANSKGLPVEVLNLPATQTISGSVSVSNFPASQPISGSVTANIGTTNGLALDSTVSSIDTKTSASQNPSPPPKKNNLPMNASTRLGLSRPASCAQGV